MDYLIFRGDDGDIDYCDDLINNFAPDCDRLFKIVDDRKLDFTVAELFRDVRSIEGIIEFLKSKGYIKEVEL